MDTPEEKCGICGYEPQFDWVLDIMICPACGARKAGVKWVSPDIFREKDFDALNNR